MDDPPAADPPPLKTDPKYGYFPWWPEDGDAWVHPDDVAAARGLIPSTRVWRRDGTLPATPTDYVVMHYGRTRLRVRRTLWKEVRPEGFELGDVVEVRTRLATNEAHTGVVREMRWDAHAGGLRYRLLLADGTPLERDYTASDLKHVETTQPQPMTRLEPRGDAESIELEPLDKLDE